MIPIEANIAGVLSKHRTEPQPTQQALNKHNIFII